MIDGPALDPVVSTVLRAGLGLLLLASAVHKLRERRAFRAALIDYRLLPERWVPVAAAAIVGIEFAVGASLWVPATGAVPALAAATLLAVYATAIAANLARGRRHVACGCAGPAGSQTIHWGLVARNLLLALLAVAAAYPSTQRPLVWFDAVTGTGALACLALLYAASDVALANLGRLRALRAGP